MKDHHDDCLYYTNGKKSDYSRRGLHLADKRRDRAQHCASSYMGAVFSGQNTVDDRTIGNIRSVRSLLEGEISFTGASTKPGGVCRHVPRDHPGNSVSSVSSPMSIH